MTTASSSAPRGSKLQSFPRPEADRMHYCHFEHTHAPTIQGNTGATQTEVATRPARYRQPRRNKCRGSAPAAPWPPAHPRCRRRCSFPRSWALCSDAWIEGLQVRLWGRRSTCKSYAACANARCPPPDTPPLHPLSLTRRGPRPSSPRERLARDVELSSHPFCSL